MQLRIAKLEKIRKKIIFSKFTPSNLITYKFEQNVYVYHFIEQSVPFPKSFGFLK